MLMIITIFYIFFVLIDGIPIIKNKRWNVLVIYSVLITTAYTFSVLNEVGVKIPSPANTIKKIVTSIIGK